MAKTAINVQGTVFEYSGSNNPTERLNSTERLGQDLVLQVSSQCSLDLVLIILVNLIVYTPSVCYSVYCWCLKDVSFVLNFVFFPCISIEVLCVGNLYSPDVRYSFNIPVEEKSEAFVWDSYGPWQDCSKMCQGTCYAVAETQVWELPSGVTGTGAAVPTVTGSGCCFVRAAYQWTSTVVHEAGLRSSASTGAGRTLTEGWVAPS